MGGIRLNELSEKPDSNLNIIMAKIRSLKTEDGHDAFVLFKQGTIPKSKLTELIAKALI